MPGSTRTMAPAISTSIAQAGAGAAGGIAGSVRIGTKPEADPGAVGKVPELVDADEQTAGGPRGGREGRSHLGRQRQQAHTCLAPPREHLLRTNLPASRHLGWPGAGSKALNNHPSLVLRRPAPAPARPGQHLYPAIPSPRVVINVKHSVSSKLPASSRPTTPSAHPGRTVTQQRLPWCAASCRCLRLFPPRDRLALHEAVLDEILEERTSSSRGRQVPRGVKRKMSGYPLRPRTPQPATWIDFNVAIRISK